MQYFCFQSTTAKNPTAKRQKVETIEVDMESEARKEKVSFNHSR